VPYPTLFVVGGLGLAPIPGLPAIELQPEIVFGIKLGLQLITPDRPDRIDPQGGVRARADP